MSGIVGDVGPGATTQRGPLDTICQICIYFFLEEIGEKVKRRVR